MPDPLATLTDRLRAEYLSGFGHADIDRVVRQCRADLAGTPQPSHLNCAHGSPAS